MADHIFDGIIEEIRAALLRHERIEVRDFGSFIIRKYPPYEGRNPKSGKLINVKEKFRPFFKPGKKLRELVNEKFNLEKR